MGSSRGFPIADSANPQVRFPGSYPPKETGFGIPDSLGPSNKTHTNRRKMARFGMPSEVAKRSRAMLAYWLLSLKGPRHSSSGRAVAQQDPNNERTELEGGTSIAPSHFMLLVLCSAGTCSRLDLEGLEGRSRTPLAIIGPGAAGLAPATPFTSAHCSCARRVPCSRSRGRCLRAFGGVHRSKRGKLGETTWPAGRKIWNRIAPFSLLAPSRKSSPHTGRPSWPSKPLPR